MPPRDYILTEHAKDRMRDRGISESDLESVLMEAEIKHPGPHGDINLIRTIKGRKIKISYIMDGGKKKIITVMVVN
jgi:Domain of unknown function (DUF4258)